MAWKETDVHEERMKFVVAWKQGGWTKTDLCREFGISRVTGDKYLKQYENFGIDGLKNRSTKPKGHPAAVEDKYIKMLLRTKDDYPSWGAKKLLPKLRGRYPNVKNWPSISSISRILKRNGRVKNRKRIRRANHANPLIHAIEPNDVWCADYKGHFTVGNGKRCDPLTVTDAYSRYLIGCNIVEKMDSKHAIKVFKILFKEYGLPDAIRTDNGVPFSSTSIAGLSQLSVWWLKLGISLERIEPGKPSQNGRHERMHLTLKQETALPPRSSLKAQQSAFDYFKNEFNFERPHEALKMRFPSQLYKKSKRQFPEKLPEVVYPTNMAVYTVGDMGFIRYGMYRIHLCPALRFEQVALEDIDDRHFRIYFCNVVIGIFDSHTGKVLRYRNPVPIKNGNEVENKKLSTYPQKKERKK